VGAALAESNEGRYSEKKGMQAGNLGLFADKTRGWWVVKKMVHLGYREEGGEFWERSDQGGGEAPVGFT